MFFNLRRYSVALLYDGKRYWTHSCDTFDEECFIDSCEYFVKWLSLGVPYNV